MKKTWPSISIIIINKNAGAKLEKSLREIEKQDFPREKMEILIIDGGSTDNSHEIAKKYRAKFIYGGYPDNQEARRFVGARMAKNEILVWIDSDNYMTNKKWLQQMLEPLNENEKIFAAETLRYAYRKKDTTFNRYCALFGINDPVAFYLGKADRLTYYDKKWTLKGEANDRGKYFDVELGEDLPTVGCNGFVIRRAVLEKVLTIPEDFFHIDVIYDLIKKGYNHMAFVKNEIVHETSDSLKNLVIKRISYFRSHALTMSTKRRYRVYDPNKRQDNIRLLLFIIFTLTLIKPLFDALRGFVKIKDWAWFLHPMVCILFLYAYGLVMIKQILPKFKFSKGEI